MNTWILPVRFFKLVIEKFWPQQRNALLCNHILSDWEGFSILTWSELNFTTGFFPQRRWHIRGGYAVNFRARCSAPRFYRFSHFFWLTTTVSTVTIILIFVSSSSTVGSQESPSVRYLYSVATYTADNGQMEAFLGEVTGPYASKVNNARVPASLTETSTVDKPCVDSSLSQVFVLS